MEVGDIVLSRTGRDAGRYYFVVGVEGDFLLLANGRQRRLDRPKRKNMRHVQRVQLVGEAEDARIRLIRSESTTDSALRRLLIFSPESGTLRT